MPTATPTIDPGSYAFQTQAQKDAANSPATVMQNANDAAGKAALAIGGTYDPAKGFVAPPISAWKDNTGTKPITSISSQDTQSTINQNNQDMKTIGSEPRGTVNVNGFDQYTDGSYVAAPDGAVRNPDGYWSYQGKNYLVGPSVGESPATKENNDLINQTKASANATLTNTLNDIQSRYNTLITQQQDINKRAEAGFDMTLFASGAERHSASASGSSGAEQSFGLSKIKDLVDEENRAINDAQMAYQKSDYELLDKKLTLIKETRDKQQEAANKTLDRLDAQNKAVKSSKDQQDKDMAIAGVISKLGTTDPTSLLNELQKQGNTLVTAKDIGNFLDTIAKSTGGTTKNASNAVEAFYALKKTPGGLPTDILALPTEAQQLFEFAKRYNQSLASGSAAGKPTPTTNTPDDKILSVPDAKALGVPYGTTVGQARALGKTPSDLSSATKTMTEAAPSVINFVDKLNKEISDAASGLGPAASRWREFNAGKIGLDDSAFTEIRTNMGLLTTLLMRMHTGARGGQQIMEHFQSLIDASKQSPTNMKAALKEIREYAQSLIAEHNGAGKSLSGSAATDYINNPVPGSSASGNSYDAHVWGNAQ